MKAPGLFVLASACLNACTSAVCAPTGPRPAGNRYLFVVNTSAAMTSLALASRQAVFDMIYFGVDEQMRQGDTFGVWTFDQEPHTGIFPMQTWHPDQTLELSSRAAKFLKGQTYHKRANLEPVMARLSSVINAVRDVNVFIITDGEASITDAPFAEELRLACAERAGARRLVKKPFVMTLVARGGKVVQTSVTLPGEPIMLPLPPEVAHADKTKDKSESPDRAGASSTPGETSQANATNSGSATLSSTNLAATAVTNLVSAPPMRAPIIMTNPIAAAPRKVIEIKTLSNAPPESPAQPVPVTANTTAPPEKPDPPKAAVTSSPPVAIDPAISEEDDSDMDSTASAETAAPPLRAAAKTEVATPPFSPAPTMPAGAVPVAAREPPSSAPAAQGKPSVINPMVAASAPTNARYGHSALLGAGALLFLAALGLSALSLRRLRGGRPSIISRSIEGH